MHTTSLSVPVLPTRKKSVSSYLMDMKPQPDNLYPNDRSRYFVNFLARDVLQVFGHEPQKFVNATWADLQESPRNSHENLAMTELLLRERRIPGSKLVKSTFAVTQRPIFLNELMVFLKNC